MGVWFKDEAVYQIYPRSYQDTNGDGIGDLNGIIQHLDDLKDLGIGAVWLSPVYRSPGVDNGYDISDYRDIDPQFGTLADMDRLIAEANRRGIRIVMDLVINHTSDQHEWFKKSCANDPKYKDYYIWRPAKANGKAPNNWSTFFAEDAWEWNEERGEYYLHLFAKGQPDLNYNNPAVLEEVKDILRFWLDRGVSGFRCDVINILYKSTLKNGRMSPALRGIEHYLSQEGNHEILRTLRREVLGKYDCFTVGETVLVDLDAAKKLCDESRGELDMVFAFEQMDADQIFVKWLSKKFNPRQFIRILSKWQKGLGWNANYFENHDQPRSVSRYGDEGEYREQSAKMLGLLLLSLRGTPYIYQGEELGMTNCRFASLGEMKDVESHNVDRLMKKLGFSDRLRWRLIQLKSRDNSRTPYQWSSGKNAGFTEGAPWLKINDNYKKINFEAQRSDPNSVWSFYRDMLAFRKSAPAMTEGGYKELETSKYVYVFERSLGSERYVVAVNFSKENQRAGCSGQVVMSSCGRKVFNGTLMPFEGIILKEDEK